MFDNISSLRFQDGSSNETLASAMISSEGEVMEFKQAIATDGRVEDWMTNVLNEMRRTNRLITKEAIYKYCDNIERYCISFTFRCAIVSSILFLYYFKNGFECCIKTRETDALLSIVLVL